MEISVTSKASSVKVPLIRGGIYHTNFTKLTNIYDYRILVYLDGLYHMIDLISGNSRGEWSTRGSLEEALTQTYIYVPSAQLDVGK